MSEGEDKIVIETKLPHVVSNGRKMIELSAMQSILVEVYGKAINIGWETKALDPIAEELRRVQNT